MENNMNLPLDFEYKIKTLLKDEFDAYIQCYEQPRFYGLRVNTQKISVDKFLEISPFPLTPIPWITNGFYYDGTKIQPAKHPYYYAGLYYLQEPSAMTPADRLPICPGDKVLDLCAAPGGKSTELGARLLGNGVLVANDISNSRAKGLLKNIELFGISNVLVLSEEPQKLITYFESYFDKILVDAPCSGEGMFRKDKKMVNAWEEHGPTYFAKIQREIIIQAGHMLKPGGMLLYSTCTFDPQENEQLIEYLIQELSEFTIMDMKPYKDFDHGYPEVTNTHDSAYEKTVRIWPHKMQGEGHYLALLKKESKPLNSFCPKIKSTQKITDKITKEFYDFFEKISWDMDWNRLYIQEERIYYLPKDMPELKGLRFLRTGLYLGDMKKKRFEPSQHLAMCLQKDTYQSCINLEVTDQRVFRYLKGETIEVTDKVILSEKGWYLVLVNSYPLGWGKLSNGTLKNKYCVGWRWQS